jgi:hypothetical protein
MPVRWHGQRRFGSPDGSDAAQAYFAAAIRGHSSICTRAISL